jgi:hypothetical protein
MRKIVMAVMVGALVLLLLAGVSALIRRPDEGPSIRSVAAVPEAPAPPAVAPAMTTPLAPQPEPAIEAETPSQAAAAPARAPAQVHRGKPAAPHKARTPRTP